MVITNCNYFGHYKDEKRQDDEADDLLDFECHWLHMLMAKSIKNLLSLSIAYPYFPSSYVATYIERPETQADELAEYKRTYSRLMLTGCSLLVLSSTIYFCRVVTLPWLAFHEHDYNNVTANLHWYSNGTISRVNCILTNCHRDRVNVDDLAQNISQMPLFSLCHTKLARVHDVLQYMDIYGLLLTTILCLWIVLAGIISPIFNICSPPGNLFLMFLVAPRVTRRVVQDRAQELAQLFQKSLNNFGDKFNAIELGYQRRERLDLSTFEANDIDQLDLDLPFASSHFKYTNLINDINIPPIQPPEAFPKLPPNNYLRYRMQKVEQLVPSVGDIGHDPAQAAYAERFIYDCVTMMRSSWWHKKASKGLAALLLTNASNLVVLTIASAITFRGLAMGRRELFKNFVGDLNDQWDCNIWVANNYSSTSLERALKASSNETKTPADLGTSLNLGDLEDSFPVRSLFGVVQTTWPLACIYFFLVVYVLSNAELMCWLHEIKLGLTLGAEFVKQLKPARYYSGNRPHGRRRKAAASHSLKDIRESSQLTDNSRRQRFDMNILRAQMSQLFDLNLLLISKKMLGRRSKGGHTKLKLEHALAIREFVASAIERHHLDLGSASELLEKLYINLRIFIEHMEHYGGIMTVMLTFINLYTHGLVLIGILFVRSIKDFLFVPFFIIIVGWVTANLTILGASNFHAKARRLHMLIWSLVAAMDGCHEVEIDHMRSLWLKQVQALDLEGGLALKAWGVRITYVRIIQLIVGSGTLVVFALRD